MKLRSSASFSPSIRISLRLKIHQAQAKNFCRVLDIRVSEVVKAHVLLDACVFQQLPVDPRHGVRTPVAACAGRREQDGVVRVLLVLLHEQVYRLLRQRHLADGVFRFRLRHIQLALHAGDLLIHRQDALFYIQVLPL